MTQNTVWVIEFRSGTYFQSLDADFGGPIATAQQFPSKQAADVFMSQHDWILYGGGMAVQAAAPVPADVVPADVVPAASLKALVDSLKAKATAMGTEVTTRPPTPCELRERDANGARNVMKAAWSGPRNQE